MFDIENYELKTDREAQWAKLEQYKREADGMTRKQIAFWRDMFWSESAKGDDRTWLHRFLYHSNPTIEGWQHFFDHDVGVEIGDHEFAIIEGYLSYRLGLLHFCAEDLAYYFTAAFGETYDSARRFPLRFNGEKERRVNTLGPNRLFGELLSGVIGWLAPMRGEDERNIVPYKMEFLDSLLPLVDQRVFTDANLEQTDKEEGDLKRLWGHQMHVETCMRFTRFEACAEIPQDRIDYASMLVDKFEAQAGGAGFERLRERAGAELEDWYEYYRSPRP